MPLEGGILAACVESQYLSKVGVHIQHAVELRIHHDESARASQYLQVIPDLQEDVLGLLTWNTRDVSR